MKRFDSHDFIRNHHTTTSAPHKRELRNLQPLPWGTGLVRCLLRAEKIEKDEGIRKKSRFATDMEDCKRREKSSSSFLTR
jgi:hypothetical protein